MSTVNAAAPLAADTRGLEQLRLQAKSDPRAAVKGAAQQFEAVFLNLVLKSMREAMAGGDGFFDSEQTRFYTSLLDQQLAQALAKRGIGLADAIAKQLARGVAPPGPDAARPALPAAPGPAQGAPEPSAEGAAGSAPSFPQHVRDFVNRLWPYAVEASRATGIPPHFILGQAALESGWGRSEIRAGDGSASYNLFGIKAGRGWNGPVAEVTTTEYVNGVAQKVIEKFRAYSSYSEAFLDYARLLRSNPRYAAVIENGRDPEGFARGLQQAGYATDPRYAEKLLRIIHGSVLRQSLTG